jgi:hypothetical protein
MGFISVSVQRGNQAFSFGYKHVFHGLSSIIRQEGPKALFKGVGARMVRRRETLYKHTLVTLPARLPAVWL